MHGFRVGMSASQARRELGTDRYFELPDQEHEINLGEMPWATAIKLFSEEFARRYFSSFRSLRNLSDNRHKKHKTAMSRRHDVTIQNSKASINLPLPNTTRVYKPRTIPSNLFSASTVCGLLWWSSNTLMSRAQKSLQYQSISISIFFFIGRFRKTLSP